MPKLARLVRLAVLPLAAACGAGGAPEDGSSVQDALRGALLVSAAASLTEAFGEIAREFETLHPGVDVQLNLAGSSTLRAQILEGAPVDVFASASVAVMEGVTRAGLVEGEARIFARNRMVVAVPAGNPAGLEGLGDLARGELLVGLCAEAVPCGDLAGEVLARAGVQAAVDTREPDVRALLTKVELGELDAGLVYTTDVEAAGGGVEALPLPPGADAATEYPVAVLTRASNPEAARAFVAFVLSPRGRAALSRAGFRSP